MLVLRGFERKEAPTYKVKIRVYLFKDEVMSLFDSFYELLIEETSDIIVSRANLFSSRATLFALPILSKFHSILMTSFEYPLDSTES